MTGTALVFSAAPWLAAAYLLIYLLVSGFLAAAARAGAITTLILAITLLGIPLLVAAAAVVRGWAVAGPAAENYDDIAVLHSRTPVVLAVVAVLAFGLLLVALRLAVIPLISVGLNLLSVGAACGLVTLIFQDGRLQGRLHRVRGD
ncbi:MAG: hypothetical protein ACLPUO_24985 [Streptosporangiaceae bacterium]|jgi:hypothetical protein